MTKILVLCTGNSVRSQITHGFLENLLKEKADVYSAGTNPCYVHPKAIKVMAESGIDISKHTSNHVDEYMSINFDYIITVCDNAKEKCPFFPGGGKKIHNNFSDPSAVWGSEEVILNSFRKTREEIKNFCNKFIKEYNLLTKLSKTF